MNIGATISNKKTINNELKKQYGIYQKYKPLGLIKLSNKDITDKLIEGLQVLSAGFIIVSDTVEDRQVSKNVVIISKLDESKIAGFDFVVGDDDISQINLFTDAGVTPIINSDNHLNNIFTEFNPLKNEGNSFYYQNKCQWSIFYTIVRYMENYKFPFDNKNLVKNVMSV